MFGGADCVPSLSFRYHEHFPNRQRGTHGTGLPSHRRVPEFDRRKLRVPQPFFRRLSGGLLEAHTLVTGESLLSTGFC
jgi:hypothetical protein